MPDDETSSDLTDAIADAAALPKKATGDNGSTEERDLSELIAADKYLAGKRATASGLPGFKLSKIVPGGPA